MRFIGFDTETFLIMPGILAPRLVCLTLADQSTRDLVSHAHAVSWFRDLLNDPQVTLIGHNAAFDLAVLVRAGVPIAEVFAALLAGRVRDTKIREQLILIAEGRLREGRGGLSLADLEAKYCMRTRTGKEGDNVWRLRYHELVNVPVEKWPREAQDYALDDASGTRDVFFAQDREYSTVVDEVPQVCSAFALHLMSCWGLRTDAERAKTFESNVRKAVEEANDIARRAGFLRADGTKDMNILRQLVYDAYNGSPPLTPKGQEAASLGLPIELKHTSTSSDVLEESGDERLEKFAELGPFQKLLTTYVPQLKDPDVPINHGYNVLVNTGRTSAYSPNTQNPPRAGGFRECFIPRDGYVYCSVDYDAAELRALAQIWYWRYGTSALRDVFLQGKDPHTEVARTVYNSTRYAKLTYEDVVSIKKEKTHKLYETFYGAQGLRQLGKIVNFGIPGGQGRVSIVKFARQYGVQLTLQQAVDLIHYAKETYPELELYFAEASNETMWGDATLEAWVSGRVRGGVGYTQWCNSQFQSLVADAAKAALVEVSRLAYTDEESPLYGARPVLFIHDEIIAEIPYRSAKQATLAADEMARVMCEVAGRYMPDVPVTAAPALWSRWLKGAESKRLPDGTLEVCDE